MFASNKFWKNIGCKTLAPKFGVEGDKLWDKWQGIKISGDKSNIMGQVDFYEVCTYSIFCYLVNIIITILTLFFLKYLWHLLHQG